MTATMTEKYQGWKNHATWCVALHINNEHGSQEYAQHLVECARDTAPDCAQVHEGIWTVDEATRFALADDLREWIEGVLIPTRHNNSFRDLLRIDALQSFLEDVDWNEIAASFLAVTFLNMGVDAD